MAKSISEEKYKELDKVEQKKYSKEWCCTCKECGEKWHYLGEVESKMKGQMLGNSLLHTSMCCNPCVSLTASNANTQLDKQVKELKQCPKCKSSNVKREAKYYKKEE